MDIWLIAIGSGVCGLVGQAFWYSLFARTKQRWLYLALGLLLFLWMSGSAGVLLAGSYALWSDGAGAAYFSQAIALAALIIVGGFWLYVRGARLRDGRMVASGWPCLRLLFAWLALGGLYGLTMFLLDRRATILADSTRSRQTAEYLALFPPMPADNDNAATTYSTALDEISRQIEEYDAVLEKRREAITATRPAADPDDEIPSNIGRLFDPECRGQPETLELLSRLEAPLAQVREASRQSVCRFTERPDLPSITADLSLSRLTPLRAAATAFAARAMEQARRGRPDGAMDDILTIRRLAEHMDQTDPCIISGLLRIGTNELAMSTLVEILPFFDRLADLPAGTLPEVAAARKALDRDIRGEESSLTGSLLDLAQGRFGLGGSSRPAGPPPAANPQAAFGYRILWLRQDLPAVSRYNSAMRDRLAAGDTANWSRIASGKPTEGGPLVRMLLPSLNRVLTMQANFEANSAQARIALALTAYRLRHGHYPDALASLVPEFLPAVPSDPFDSKPMRYRLEKNGDAIIYSVGEDLKDDGGVVEYSLQRTPGAATDFGYTLHAPK